MKHKCLLWMVVVIFGIPQNCNSLILIAENFYGFLSSLVSLNAWNPSFIILLMSIYYLIFLFFNVNSFISFILNNYFCRSSKTIFVYWNLIWTFILKMPSKNFNNKRYEVPRLPTEWGWVFFLNNMHVMNHKWVNKASSLFFFILPVFFGEN